VEAVTDISAEGERWKIYNGDALIVLPGLERNVSLIVTDPPYGVDYLTGWADRKKIVDDITAETVIPILKCACRLYPNSNQHLYVFGPFDLSLIPGTAPQMELVWNKDGVGMGDLDSAWSKSYEQIQFTVAKTNRACAGVMRKRKNAVLTYKKLKGALATRHPTEKPVPLLRDLVESSSKFDDVVLDPFMGVGSTGVAALLEGRRFVGVEIDPDYFSTAAERLREAEKAWSNQAGI
jgi:DNA modification methylase